MRVCGAGTMRTLHQRLLPVAWHKQRVLALQLPHAARLQSFPCHSIALGQWSLRRRIAWCRVCSSQRMDSVGAELYICSKNGKRIQHQENKSSLLMCRARCLLAALCILDAAEMVHQRQPRHKQAELSFLYGIIRVHPAGGSTWLGSP